MIKLPSTRILISTALVILFLIFLAAVLFITNLSFSVWAQLQQKPDWVIWSYLSAIILAAILFGRIIWRLQVPKNSLSAKKHQSKTPVDNMDAVAQRLENLSQNLSAQTIPTLSGISPPGLSTKPQQPVHIEKKPENNQDVTHTASDIDAQLQNEKKWASEFETSAEVAAIRSELEEYARRKEQQTLYIAMFGEISSGKSSLIKALIAESSPTQEKAQE